ncbi:MAG: sulfotransferase [Gammaproteobacteria bacterium]|nr:sulfotransferase [Gammaproteobacteria bacterium]MCW8972155.1 sulfotransferase [Gammaproteobacteria bacterium]MCW8992450.1 sulfotransferase [Gammaproteobacteria bacterium]
MNQPQDTPVDIAKKLGEQLAIARNLYARGELEKSAVLAHGILTQLPDHQGALHVLTMINRDTGHLDAAEQMLKRLEALTGAKNPDVLYEWGVLHYYRGEPIKAETRLRELLAKVPNHGNGHMVLGRIYDRLGQLGRADIHLRRALESRPNDETICKDLAGINERLGLFDTASRFARLAYNNNPKYIDGIVMWAKVEERRGDLAEAERLIEYARSLAPEQSLIALVHSLIQRRKGDYEQALKTLEAADFSRVNLMAQAQAWQGRGFCLERLGRFDAAFAAISRMSDINRMPPINRNYPEGEMKEQFSKLKQLWASAEQDKLPTVKVDSSEWPTPVFILGFPRSGTTMVEQILSSHRDVLAGDETHALDQALGRMSGSGSQSSISQPSERLFGAEGGKYATALANQYMGQVRRQAILEPDYAFFTDKTPLNEIHLGLIHSVLPEAPMVHLVRHPLNVVLSSFFNDVRHGRNFATRLETTAAHYAHTMDMVETYCERLDMRYLRIRYEDVVNDLEGNARQIIDFIGLPWDERCLDFHENKRHVRTASANQVKEKLYTRSLERYKPFLKQLEPIIPTLEPYISRLGYTI